MKSLTFVLEATLLAPLMEFATSTSGHVEPRQGLALGWLGSVVAGLAVVFGTADRAQADPCNEGWHCSDPPEACEWHKNGNVLKSWNYYYSHSPTDGCIRSSSSCVCTP